MSYRQRENWLRGRNKSGSDLAIFRRVYDRDPANPRLAILCGRLAAWKFKPESMEVYVPSTDNPLALRAELVKAKEVLSRENTLKPTEVVGAKMHQDLHEYVPTLGESLTDGSIKLLEHQKNSHGGHFLAFILDDENAAALGIERNRIWHSMEVSVGITPGSSNWKAYHPFVDLAYIPPQIVPDSTIEQLVKVIGGLAEGLPVQLGPVELPHA